MAKKANGSEISKPKGIVGVKPKVILDADGNPVPASNTDTEKKHQYLNSLAILSCGISMVLGGSQAITRLGLESEIQDPELIEGYESLQEAMSFEYARMLEICDESAVSGLRPLVSAFASIATHIAQTKKAYLGSEIKWIEGIINGDLMPVETSIFKQALSKMPKDGGQ